MICKFLVSLLKVKISGQSQFLLVTLCELQQLGEEYVNNVEKYHFIYI